MANCLTTDTATSRPELAGNLFKTLQLWAAQLFADIWDDSETHSPYIVGHELLFALFIFTISRLSAGCCYFVYILLIAVA